MSIIKERRYTLLQYVKKAEACHIVAAFEPENIFYLTGFWGEAIAVCMDNGTKTKLITPKLEYSRAQKASIDCEVIATERGSELISTFVSQIKGRRKIIQRSKLSQKPPRYWISCTKYAKRR